MPDGSLLIKTTSIAQQEKIKNLTTLNNTPITTSSDPVRNSSKGTIYAKQAQYYDTDLITNELNRLGTPTLNTYRFAPNRNYPTQPNPRLLITFNTPNLPSEVDLGFQKYNVQL